MYTLKSRKPLYGGFFCCIFQSAYRSRPQKKIRGGGVFETSAGELLFGTTGCHRVG